MNRALADTRVLYAAFDRRDNRRDTGLAILRDADAGRLPVLVIPDVVVAETMNALTQRVAHDATVDAIERLEESAGFAIRRTTEQQWAMGREIYERHPPLSYVDSVLVARCREREHRARLLVRYRFRPH
ncbi:type II toxin-antitoxin system VapC family toxin [Halovivax limisalsi]|uniref:type II toxin-antitoxin system VapC family toxin n=1 Tax=Halovivax limisalsi TaxID=1453760 RepID=UPI001FFD22B3|nr:PIN domain-containing protein [Halovivax limisalsi]